MGFVDSAEVADSREVVGESGLQARPPIFKESRQLPRASFDSCVEWPSHNLLFHRNLFMAIIAMKRGSMRSVNVAELKNRLSKYLTFVKAGQEVVIRDRNLPVAKIIPFTTADANDQELLLVAAGKLRLPSVRLDIKELLKIRTGTVSGNKAIRALQADRDA